MLKQWKFRSILMTVLVILGLAFTVGPSTGAQAAVNVPKAVVVNSGLSTGSLLVCGHPQYDGRCYTVPRGNLITGAGTGDWDWKPVNVAVGAGWCILYRVEKPNFISPWMGLCGASPSGSWLNIPNLQYTYGVGITVNIIVDYHG